MKVALLKLWAEVTDRVRHLHVPTSNRPGMPEGAWVTQLGATLLAIAAGGAVGAAYLWAALALPWWA